LGEFSAIFFSFSKEILQTNLLRNKKKVHPMACCCTNFHKKGIYAMTQNAEEVN